MPVHVRCGRAGEALDVERSERSWRRPTPPSTSTEAVQASEDASGTRFACVPIMPSPTLEPSRSYRVLRAHGVGRASRPSCGRPPQSHVERAVTLVGDRDRPRRAARRRARGSRCRRRGKSPRSGEGSSPRSYPRIAATATSCSNESQLVGSSSASALRSASVRARQCQSLAVSRRARSRASRGARREPSGSRAATRGRRAGRTARARRARATRGASRAPRPARPPRSPPGRPSRAGSMRRAPPGAGRTSARDALEHLAERLRSLVRLTHRG